MFYLFSRTEPETLLKNDEFDEFWNIVWLCKKSSLKSGLLLFVIQWETFLSF